MDSPVKSAPKLKPKELRVTKPTEKELSNISRRQIYIIIENVLDTYNVGAIFRLADAIAASKVYLVGDTAVPTDPKVGHKIHKASVGVWQWIPWEHTNTVRSAIEKANIECQMTNVKFQTPSHSDPALAGEESQTDDTSHSAGLPLPRYTRDRNDINSTHNPQLTTHNHLRVYAIEQNEKSIPYTEADFSGRIAFIVGHETTGVSKEALELSDAILEIPMFGVNTSLNVMVSLAIVLWEAVRK